MASVSGGAGTVAVSFAVPSFLIRARVAHVPHDPFASAAALSFFEDGAVAVDDKGKVTAAGEFGQLRGQLPDSFVLDERDALLLPGLVDAHVHFPQVPVLGAMGYRLLEWLKERTIPEELRFRDREYARREAEFFLRALLRSGTTSALVFGAHFPGAMEEFFAAAHGSGLRVFAGLNVSDRLLDDGLHVDPESAYREGRRLAEAWHGRGRLGYAVTPRFSLSCSDPLLEACGALAEDVPGVLVTSHLNENEEEIAQVASLFPGARHYLDSYARHGLVGERSVFAHDVHPSDSELAELALAKATVCHCPTSNMFIGSGLFPFERHVRAGVRVALGSDVGGGTGFGILKEGLAAHQVQMLRHDGLVLTPTQILYLATSAGAQSLGLPAGDFAPGREFDAVLLRAPAGSVLERVWQRSESAESLLAGTITLAREESVAGVWVGGQRLL